MRTVKQVEFVRLELTYSEAESLNNLMLSVVEKWGLSNMNSDLREFYKAMQYVNNSK